MSQMQAAEASPRLRDFIGINGHTVQFKPELYQPVGRLVRDYHPVEWDLGANPAGRRVSVREERRGLEPRLWLMARQRVAHRCLPDVRVGQPHRTGRTSKPMRGPTGRHSRSEFGPSGKRRLVESVEIGNEPGKWSDADYRAHVQGHGGRDPLGRSRVKIATCNVTTGKSGDYEKSVDCVADSPESIRRVEHPHLRATRGLADLASELSRGPEAARTTFRMWRRFAAGATPMRAGKPIWITEFGYDSSTKSPAPRVTSRQWVGVTDTQQAQWLVRSLLVFSAMPVERAYVYFFNDEDQPSLHASSGITRHFQPKPSFHALAHLQRVLGDYRFQRIVTNQPAGCASRNIAMARTKRRGPFGRQPGKAGISPPRSTAPQGNCSLPNACR